MDGKKSFEPGELVRSLSGQVGIVVSQEVYLKLKNRLREGKRPGHHFAPGCCHNPDYVTQVPVVFEDRTYDVMRALNISRAGNVPKDTKALIETLIRDQDQ